MQQNEITELKKKITQLENQLSDVTKQKDLYEEIFDRMPIGLQIYDQDGFSERMNYKLQEILGIPDRTIGVGTFNVLTDPFSVEHKANVIFQQAYDGEEKVEREYQYNYEIAKNTWQTATATKYLREIIFPIKDADNNVTRVIALVLDNTIEKELGKSLEESNLNLQIVFDNVFVGMIFACAEAKILSTNQAFCDMLEYSQDEIKEISFRDITYPDDLDKENTYVEKAYKGELDSYTLEKRIYKKDKTILWVEVAVTVVRNSKGDVLHFVVVCVDISEKKKTFEKLRESEERWKYALEGAGDGMWDWNLITNEVYFSDQWKKMLGYESNEISNDLNEWEIRVHPDDLEASKRNINDHISGATKEYINEHRLRTKTGKYKWILDRGKVVQYDITGKPMRMIGTHSDITDRINLMHEIRNKETFLDTILNTVQVGIIRIEKYTRDITFFNQKALELLDIREEEIRTKKCYDFFGTECMDCVFEKNELKQGSNKKIEIKTESGLQRSLLKACIHYKQLHEEFILLSFVDITDKEVIESELRESQKRYESIFNNAVSGIVFTDVDTTIIEANRAFAVFLGYTREEIVGKKISSFTHHEEITHQKEVVDSFLKKGENTANYSRRYTTKSGGYVWLKLSVSVIRNEKNEAINFVATAHDVTQEKKLSEERTALATIIENVGDIAVMKDLNLRVVATNPAFVKASGKENTNELIGKTDAEIFGVDEHTEPIRTYMEDDRNAQKLPKGKVLEREEDVVYPDGEIRKFHTIKFPVFDENNVLTGTANISRDITERKRMELELKASESKLRQLTENIEIVFWLRTFDQIIYISPAYEKIWGRSCQSLYDNPYGFVDSIYTEDKDRVRTKLTSNDFMKNGYFNEEYRIVRPDNSIRWVTARSFPSRKEDGTFDYTVGFAEDITERKHLEFALSSAKQDAEKAMSLRTKFLANISHEFRTPLSAVLGFGELLKSKLVDDISAQYLDNILTSASALLDLINDILDISKIESGKFALNLEPVNLKNLIQDIFKIFSLTAENKDISLLLSFSNSIPEYYYLDQVRIRQILLNVIGNAVKFTEIGYVGVEVEAYSKRGDKFDLKFTFTDTGVGISKEDQQSIFEAFTQSYTNVKYENRGTGLGLAITKKILEMMDGKINVESEVGKGSVFEIILPNLETVPEKLLESASKKDKYDNVVFNNQKVLIIDNNKLNHTLIKNYAINKKLQIYHGYDIEEGKNLFYNIYPDILFIHYELPDGSGIEFARSVSKLKEAHPHSVIGICSGDRDHILTDAIKEWIHQPIIRVALMEVLCGCLEYSTVEDYNKKIVDVVEEDHCSHTPFLNEKFRAEIKNQFEDLIKNSLIAIDFDDMKKLLTDLYKIEKVFSFVPFTQYVKELDQSISRFNFKDIQNNLKKLLFELSRET